MALGFVTLAIVEAIMLLTSTGNLANVILPSVNIELPHIVLLVMLALFGLGLLKANWATNWIQCIIILQVSTCLTHCLNYSKSY